MSPGFFSAWKWSLFALVILLYSLRAVSFIDPDLGWHLAAGDYVIAHDWTPPAIDPYSYTLANHPWIDHEWLVDGLIANEVNEGRFTYVVAVFALMALALPFLWFKRAKTSLALLVALLASGLIMTISGVRPQVISMLFFLLLYEGLFTLTGRARTVFYWGAPFFFYLWANLHGGFVAGLLLFALAISPRLLARVRKWRKKERRRVDPEIVSFIASCVATFATPYHLVLWREIVDTSFSPITSEIGEWRSPLLEASLPLVLLLSLSIAIIGVSWRELPRLRIVIAALFSLLFLKHVRMMPFALVATMPILFLSLERFEGRLGQLRYRLSGVAPKTILSWAILIWSIGFAAYFALAKETTAPYRPPFSALEAIATLRERYAVKDIYNHYDFGGWLIRSFPRERVFTDGRSPHWKDESGFSPFLLQRNIERGEVDYRETFERYGLRVALLRVDPAYRTLPPNERRERFMAEHPRVYALFAKLLLPDAIAPLSYRLEKDGWCVVYRDQEAMVMVAPDVPLCAAHEEVMHRSASSASTSSAPLRDRG